MGLLPCVAWSLEGRPVRALHVSRVAYPVHVGSNAVCTTRPCSEATTAQNSKLGPAGSDERPEHMLYKCS